MTSDTRTEAVRRPAPHRADAFHALHHTPGRPLLLPNAWDSASAAALAAAGHAAIGTTSLGIAAALGHPDGEGLPAVRDATLALARRLAGRLPCPYTVDIEGGFGGGPGQVAELAAELADCGASGINLEDGLPGGGGLQVPARQAELIAAVKERVPDLFLNARIDTHWRVDTPPPLSQTLARAETYLAAGADGIFVPGVTADADITVLAREIAAPLNILFTPGRHTVRRLADLGVRRISTGSLLFRTALGAACAAADALRAGETGEGQGQGQGQGRSRGSGLVPSYGIEDAPAYGEVQHLAGEVATGSRGTTGKARQRRSPAARPR
ncbi:MULTISPECIES: isocitrate lyase/phosphoenolpyruvate mutase family protein [unclassified Streptomyces]|uniref:isocitrate lyase/PEP mutase family protein n=1 Tax=unclassified Streptomyces TaxID=2593676 RepID=UPI000366C6B3|nr:MULTISPECIES: isocitrate lyase/phosphoenolpyruvate mutase family protein [unclassified Streptomyces]MYT31045.1 isocitrate lyase/phosphoenolpyruvate mutase family protein [Streptomyces sp. SID8354]